MVIIDENGNVVDNPDLTKGRIDYAQKIVVHSYVVDAEEIGHYETVAEYPNGGRDVVWVIDSPEDGHWDTRDAEGNEVEHFDGPIADDWPKDQTVSDTWAYGLYHSYTDEEFEQIIADKRKEQEEAERDQAIQDASRAFFIDGGQQKMQADIDDAKASGGSDPALASFVTLSLPMVAPTAKDSALAPVMKYAPEYVPEGHEYKKGEVFTYEGSYYRVSQDFTSQAQWVPGSVESLCYRIEIAPDGVIVWAQPHGEYDAPDKGNKRHYPGADGPVYVSLIDANAYSPDAYPQGWQLDEG